MGKALSLVAAGLISVTLLLDPYLLAAVPSWRLHVGFPIVMLGIAGLFMHAVGFVPRVGALRTIFHPVAAWLLLAGGGAVLAGFTGILLG